MTQSSQRSRPNREVEAATENTHTPRLADNATRDTATTDLKYARQLAEHGVRVRYMDEGGDRR